MKRPYWTVIVVVIIAAAVTIGYVWFRNQGQQPSQRSKEQKQLEKQQIVAGVKTVPVRKGVITEQLTVHGTVTAAPGAVQTISVPFETSIRTIMVTAGQRVSSGDKLLEIEPSPATSLKFEQARNTYKGVKESFVHMQELYDLKLATNSQLLQAKQALEQAQLEYESMEQRGADKRQIINADVHGLISKVNVQEGAIVPPGSPFLELIAQSRLESVLGVETEDLEKVKPNQTVSLSYLNTPTTSPIIGRIRKISRAVNPATRLVDVFVRLPRSDGFLFGEAILGKITIASREGFIVPRTAVLPEADHYSLFTVKDSRAVKHRVQLGLKTEEEVEVIGSDLLPGEQVVVSGNYQLKNGMAVTTEASQ